MIGLRAGFLERLSETHVAPRIVVMLIGGLALPWVLTGATSHGQPAVPTPSPACQWAASNLPSLAARLPEVRAGVAAAERADIQDIVEWVQSGCSKATATPVETGLLDFYSTFVATTGQPPTGTSLAGLQVLTHPPSSN